MKLFKHQLRGVEWMKQRELKDNPDNSIRGGILADQMGLGKTLQMVTLLAESPKRTLLVIPKMTLRDWERNLKNKGISFSVFPERVSGDDQIQIYTMGYLSREKSCVFIETFERVVIDEGHFILNKYSRKTKNLMEIKSDFWWVLSATPVKLGSEFRNYFLLFGDAFYKNRSREDLDKIMLVRRLEDVPEIRHSFPDKTTRIVKVKGSSTTLENRVNRLGVRFLEASIRKMQGTLNPSVPHKALNKKYDESVMFTPVDFGKLAKYKRIIEDFKKEPDRPTIVFCKFNYEIHELSEYFKDETGATIGILDARTKDKVLPSVSYFDQDAIRDATKCLPLGIRNMISDYIRPPKILLCQSAIATVGINLQYYNRVFFTMPMWTVWSQDQAIARAHRYGQKKHVDASIYCLEDSIDNYFLHRHTLMRRVWGPSPT